MEQKQIFGLAGSAMLFIGVFTPIISVPIMGTMNYFMNGEGDGVIILILAAISFFLVIQKKYKPLLFTGLGSLGVMAFSYINFTNTFAEMKSEMKGELQNNPFAGLAEAFVENIQLQWGWAILIIGAGLLIAASIVKDPKDPSNQK